MAAMTWDDEVVALPARKKRGQGSRWVAGGGLALLAVIVGLTLFRGTTTSLRTDDQKTVRVILPPPPPPPPPPETKPVETPPEPKPMPIEQPTDSPPPPTPDAQPTAGDSALTAREGAGPSNYGLAVGNGGGTRIGGKAGGGDGFAAYANVARTCVLQVIQADRELSRVRFTAQFTVRMAPDGKISSVGVPSGGDGRRNARIQEVLTGIQCSQRPPEGLPVMRMNVTTRSGA